MGAQHTPAPWKDGPVFGSDGRAIFLTDETKGGKWQKRLDDKSGLFSAADARLIAAAPDLLAACQEALYLLKGREHDQFLRNAIAKASMDSSSPIDSTNK